MTKKYISTMTDNDGNVVYPQNKMESVIDLPEISTFGPEITDGLTMINGAKQYSQNGHPFFKVKKIGGDTFIYLFGVFTNIKTSSSVSQLPIMQLPKEYFDGIYYAFSSPKTGSDTASWEIQDCQLKMHFPLTSFNGSEWFPISIYLFRGIQNMKYMYKLFSDGHFETISVDENYILQNEETFDKPEDGLYLPAHFENGKIVSASETEWKQYLDKLHNELPAVSISPQDQAMAKVTVQLASQQKQIDDGNATNAKVLAQVALLTQQLVAKGGN